MDYKSLKWFVIINPVSGNGKGLKKWWQIKKHLSRSQFKYDYAFTEYASHASKLSKNAIENGFKNIIVAGGDGTLHHAINGVLSQKNVSPSKIHVGVIPIGTGNDWVKTHNIPKNIKKAIEIIKFGDVKIQDVGKIVLNSSNKKTHYFINLAGVGFDGYVANQISKYKHYGAMAYLIAALIGLFSFKNFKSSLSIKGRNITNKTLMVLVGLCRYSGGGMQLTKNPNPFDGLFDISIAKDFKKTDVIKNILNLFNGKIVTFKKVESFKNKEVEIFIDQENQPYIQVDGELIGQGSFKSSIIPKAFAFYSP